MSIASHAVNRLRDLWKTIYRHNARLNAESFSYSRHHSTATPLLEQLEPRVLLSATIMDSNSLLLEPDTSVLIVSSSSTPSVQADVLEYTITNGEVTITDCDAAATGALTIPATIEGLPVTSIGKHAFDNCDGLTSVTIPDGVTSLEYRSFYDCDGLTSITIPDNVTTIHAEALRGCNSLTSIVVSPNNALFSSVDGVLFNKNQTILLNYPAGKTGDYVIPGSVTSIRYLAFYDCDGLTSVTIPNSMTSIGLLAFYDCDGLTSVTIPDSVTSIGDRAFYRCRSLTNIAVSPGNTNYSSVDGVLFNKDQTTLLQCPAGKTGPYTIPNSVTFIEEFAFSYCDGLTSVTIPDSVTSIGHSAFSYCGGLTSVTIPDSITSFNSHTFYHCSGLTSVTIPDSVTSLSWSVFSGCSSLTSVTIPDGVTSIGTYTFNDCSRLTSVTIPDGVTSIGAYAFYRCNALASVAIPDGVTFIGAYAFNECRSLTSVTIPDSVTSLGKCVFRYCRGLTSVTISDGVTSIGERAFYACNGLTSVTIPDGVTSIGESAFYACNGLTSVTIPDSVTSIGESAFYACSGLTSVTIPDGVASIGESAFDQCMRLTRVTFEGDAPGSFAEGAFDYAAAGFTVYFNEGATGFTTPTWNGYASEMIATAPDISMLTYTIADGEVTITDCDAAYAGEMVIPATIEGLPVTRIGMAAFRQCDGLTSVTIPNSVTMIFPLAFYGCDGITNITIPSSVTLISNLAVAFCTALTSITIPDSVTTIGTRAFQGCTALPSISVSPNNASYTTVDGMLFSKDMTTLVACPAGYQGNGIIPDGVTTIEDSAFWNCDGLSSVTIPDDVTSIGEYAFSYCDNLTSVTIPASVTTMGKHAFRWIDGLTGVVFEGNAPSSMGETVFDNAAAGFTVYYYEGAAGFTTPTWNGYRTEVILTSFPVELTSAEKWTYSYTDANGDVVTVKLSGATDTTTMKLYFESDPAAEGFADDVQEIELTGTGRKTQLSISVKANKLAGDGTTTVEEISVTDGVLKAIKAKTTDLVGDGLVANAGGYVSAIDIRNLTNGADIILPGEGAAKGVSIKAGQFEEDTDVTLGSPLKGLTMAAWDDGELAAPWAKSIAIKGNKKLGIAADFGADINLTDANAKGVSLGKFTAAGTATGAIRTLGSIGSVAIASVNGFDLLAGIDPDAGRFPTIAADFVNPDASIKSVKIAGIKGQAGTFFQDCNIAAATIGSVRLCNGDFDAGHSSITAMDQATRKEIKKVSYVNKALGQKWSWPIKKGPFPGPADFIHIL